MSWIPTKALMDKSKFLFAEGTSAVTGLGVKSSIAGDVSGWANKAGGAYRGQHAGLAPATVTGTAFDPSANRYRDIATGRFATTPAPGSDLAFPRHQSGAGSFSGPAPHNPSTALVPYTGGRSSLHQSTALVPYGGSSAKTTPGFPGHEPGSSGFRGPAPGTSTSARAQKEGPGTALVPYQPKAGPESGGVPGGFGSMGAQMAIGAGVGAASAWMSDRSMMEGAVGGAVLGGIGGQYLGTGLAGIGRGMRAAARRMPEGAAAETMMAGGHALRDVSRGVTPGMRQAAAVGGGLASGVMFANHKRKSSGMTANRGNYIGGR